ncbi:MAG: c-type cytochrome [Gammaproteobacteria bacterium]|nr:c-type cytochrome [Gammaproteobacteria bacterium]
MRGTGLPAAAALLMTAAALADAGKPTDKEVFDSACAACHGTDGAGRAPEELAFAAQPADFTDCEFASREADADWYAVIHAGGPVRAFDRMMPAFGDALTADEIHAVLRHVRTFCTDDEWPRGEFNLPRPMYTEKAFPEDEAVATMTYDTGDSNAWELELLYEKRFGPRGMIEIAVPLASVDLPAGGRNSGIGDVALAYKYNFFHDLDSGNILSAGIEAILATGDEDNGLGKGSNVIEPFVAWGKILPADAFLQAHLFGEFPGDAEFDDELGLRVAIGRTWTSGGEFGRAWTPILEILAARELVSGADTNIDLVPQLQVTLSVRQHILLNLGVRVPASNNSDRDTVIGVYLIWDWFDGGFFDGW